MTKFNQSKINKALDSLQDLPQTKEVRQTIKRLKLEASKLQPKKEKSVAVIPSNVVQEKANRKRSGKLRSYHSYMRQIKLQAPEMSYKEVRKEYTKRKEHLESSISDAVWQNPSP